jgi:cytidylate kinase
MGEKRVVIAIDGPAGAGKSTIAKRVAEKLGYMHVSTGAFYRAVALWALRLGTELTDMYRLTQLANEARIELHPETSRVLLNGEDVTDAIRSPEVSDAASQVSAVPGVRRALLPVQRATAERSSVVMEGRDIGSVVFPEAQVKIFLDADPAERIQRRTLERREQDENTSSAVIAGELQTRDHRDRTRREAPLIQAPDAELVDTTGLSLEQVEEIVLRLVRARISNGKAAANSAAEALH